MKAIIKTVLPFLLAIVILASCNSSTALSQTGPTKAMETAIYAAWSDDVSATQTAMRTSTPLVSIPTFMPSTIPAIPLTPSITDDASFWQNLGAMPSNISITEYDLLPTRNPNMYEGLFKFVPTQAWPVGQADTSPTPSRTTLKALGYELNNMKLYRDGRVLFDLVTHVSDNYTIPTDSGSIATFIVEVDLGNENYVIQNDAISALGGYAIYTSAPVLYQGELLWARTYGDRVEIKKSDGSIIFTYTVPWVPNHRSRFSAWNGHWILEVQNILIQDGEILNQKLDFEEMFDWHLVRDQPFYFFRKGSRFGISYAGQVLPLQYQDIRHGLCCGPAVDNPSIGNYSAHFFGKQADVWYYVAIEFR